jgi:hypothetical protein
MKLSNETLNVLKNFSTINSGLQFKTGNKLTTVSSGKSVLAKAILADSFPQDFCVYDLNQFLSVHSLFKDSVDIEFDNSNIIFKDGHSKINYRMTAKEMIVVPPDRDIVLPSVDCSFRLTAEDYASIMKTASVLSSPNIGVESDGEEIRVTTFSVADDSAHTNSVVVGEGDYSIYKIVFKTENIKMIPGTYDVSISFKGIGHFKNVDQDIEYWIAFEATGSNTGE